MSYYSNFEFHDYHVEKDYANDAEGAEYLLEDIENEFENPDDIDWSIEAIIEYTKRQYDSANPNESKINELITRWLERISDKPEKIEKRKIQTKKLSDRIKREFDNCDESQYSSEISHIQGKKIKINTKDKAFADEVRKFIKEAIKKALKKDGRFEPVRYLLAKHDILSMEDDVPMLEASDDGISLTCPDGEDYFDYEEPTITDDELAKGLLDKIKANYPNEIQITFDDIKDIIEDMYDENYKTRSRIESYRLTPPEDYDPECFESYDDMRFAEQTKWVINGLMEKYKDQPKVLEKLRMILSKVSNYDKEFAEDISFTIGKDYIDKYLHDVLLYYIENANIDLESISLECYEEDVANLEGRLESSDFIDLLPKDFIEKMDMAYDRYDPEGKPNQYADALSELIVKYCRNSKGEKYKLEDVKRSFARSYEKRTSKAISRLSKEFEQRDDSSMKR